MSADKMRSRFSRDGCKKVKKVTERPTLSNQETNTDSTHVEPIQPILYVQADISLVDRFLPFKDTLRDGSDGGVVSSFDVLEQFREAGVVVVKFWREADSSGLCIIPVQIVSLAWRTHLRPLLTAFRSVYAVYSCHHSRFRLSCDPAKMGLVSILAVAFRDGEMRS
jgi:hypothetical protein